MTRIQLRRGTAAQWTSVNPVLASGEMGIETDTNKFKFGDGVTAWNSLDYVITGEVITDYTELDNLPSINNITLTGNKSASDLGLQEELVNGTGILISGTTISVDDSVVAMRSDIPDVSNFVTNSNLSVILQDYQPLLESGTNIKTINNQSLLGSGNIEIQSGGTYSEGTGIDITNGVISVDTDIVALKSDIPSLTGYATETWVQSQNYLTSSALTDYVTNTSLATTLEDYALSVDVPTKTSDLTNDSNFATVSQIPTNNNQLINGAGYITNSALNGYATESFVTSQGYITGITSSDVIAALDYTPYSSANPNNYTSNIGTVTSVNNTQPDANGNVSITIPDNTDFMDLSTNQTAYGTKTFNDLRVNQYIRNSSGKMIFNATGSSFSIGDTTCELTLDGSRTRPRYYDGTTNSEMALLSDIPDIDNSTITKNTSDELQTVAVIDNNSGNALKYWTGTKAQYDAIAIKDSTTLYFLSDIGKIYLGETLISNNSNGKNIGELVYSSLPLTDAGLHLLDGALIQGSGIYKGFVDYIAELYAEIQASGYKLNVNKVGSLTDNNGVLSGFSTSNYAMFPNNFQPGTNPWEMVFKVTTVNDVTTEQYVCAFQKGSTYETRYATRIYIDSSSKFCISVTYNGTAWDIVGDTTGGARGSYTVLPNTTYYLKFQWTGSAYVLSYSLDGENYTQDCYVASTTPMYNSCTYCSLGAWNNGAIVTGPGSIDLKESYININGQRWWTGAEAIKPCFCTETEWQNSVTTYGSCGKFVYDSTNNTVRLPKVSDILQGTTDLSALGDLVKAGLPFNWLEHTHTRGNMNITGGLHNNGLKAAGETDAWGAFYYSENSGRIDYGTTGGDYRPGYTFDASRSWTGSTSTPNYTSLSHDASTVQPQTIKCFVYIVIATSTKTDIEVDIDNVVSDLNSKADVDLSNTTDQAKILMSGMGMPSDKYINLTLGASGSQYTAPANGWFIFSKRGTAAGQWITADCGAQRQCYTSSNMYAEATIYMAVKKGDVLTLYYILDGENTFSRFVYAQGSESEAN